MAVPAPTSTYLDLTDGTFTANGSPATRVGSFSSSATTYRFDGTDDYLDSGSETPFTTTTSKGSISVVIHYVGGLYIASQNTSAGTAGFRLFTASGNLYFQVRPSSTDYIWSISDNTTIAAGKTYRIVATFDLVAEDVNLYVNGSEVTYTVTQDVTSGAGWPYSQLNATEQLAVGSQNNDNWTSGFNGTIEDLRFWDGTVLTSAQVTELDADILSRAQVPTPTHDYPNLADEAIFTQSGSPTFNAEDLNPGCGNYSFAPDGVNDALIHVSGGGASGTYTNVTYRWRFKASADPAANSIVLAQHSTGTASRRFLRITLLTTGVIQVFAYNGTTPASNYLSTSDDFTSYFDGNWHTMHLCIDFQAVHLYVDGANVAAYSSINSKTGSGYASITATPAVLSIGNNEDEADAKLNDHEVANVAVWDNYWASGISAYADHTALEAAVGGDAYCAVAASPIVSGVSRTGIGLNSWFTGGRRKRRRRRR